MNIAKVKEINCSSRVGVLHPHRFYTQKPINMGLQKFLFFLLIAFSLLTGCQQELEEIKLPLPAQAFDVNSITADLIKRATLHDGSFDNILDSTSCSSLVLPVTVLVNGQEVILNTEDDFKYVERILDESESDTDKVNINFPVTVVRADYSQMIIENKDALESLMDQCTEGGLDDDIECIDFVYPIKLAVYNASNEVAKVITIDSDEGLYNFIKTLQEDELVSFQFPVMIQLPDDTKVTINDNVELERAIENISDDCDEDDDVDFNDDDIDTSNLVAVLVNGLWKVDYFFDELNKTSQFSTYSFVFNADGSATATNGISSVEGSWAAYGDEGNLEVVLDFGEESPFDELMEDWEVDVFTESVINMKDDKDDKSAKALIFKKL